MFIQVSVRSYDLLGSVTTVVIDGVVHELFNGDVLKLSIGLRYDDIKQSKQE